MTKAPLQFVMILLAALAAFTLPEAKSSVREVAQGLFVPIAWPVRGVTLMLTEKLAPTPSKDILSPDKGRTVDELRKQNAELVTQVLNLQAQLDELTKRAAQYDQLGTDLRKISHAAAVVAGPAGTRQTLTISTSGLKTIREGMPVVHPQGFAGTIYTVAPGGATARVLLATDPQSHVTARFARVVQRPDGGGAIQRIDIKPPLVDGTGDGMVIAMLDARDVRNTVRVGDMVLLDDPKLPAPLRDLRIGTVSAINLPQTDAGHATIRVEPTANLAQLHEVLVVGK